MSKTMSGYRGSFDGYFQVEDASGNFGEVFPLGNTTDFSITPNAEEMEIIDTGNTNYGQAADSMVDAQPTKVSIGLNRFNIDSLIIGFQATYAARSDAQANVTDEAVTSPAPGGMVKLAGYDVSALVVEDVTDTTTYVLDTDYSIVDAALGIIKILSGGSISEDDVLHIDYTTAAETGYLVSGGAKSSYFIRLWGRGVNRFNNKRMIIKIARMSIKSSSAFPFVGTEAASQALDGTINVPTDGSAPFELITAA